MTTVWDFRVVKSRDWGRNDYSYGIHEAYYDEGDEKPRSVTEYPVALIGNTPEELKKELQQMFEAFEKPVLNYEDFDA